MLRPFESQSPKVAETAYIDPSAIVIGDVAVEADASIWPLTVVRGDVGRITIGERSNIQDGSVLHVSSPSDAYPDGLPLSVGADVTVGHRCILHACTIKDRVLVGMGAAIMDGATVESDVIIGANSLVPPGKTLVSGYLYTGSPVEQKRRLRENELQRLLDAATQYVETKKRYQS